MCTVYLVSARNSFFGWLRTSVRSTHVMGHTLGVQPCSAGSIKSLSDTLWRSIGRSKVTLMGASPATPPSPLWGDTSSIAGAEGLQAASPSSTSGRATRARQLSSAIASGSTPEDSNRARLEGSGSASARGDLAHIRGQRSQLVRVDEHDRQLRNPIDRALDILAVVPGGVEQLLHLLRARPQHGVRTTRHGADQRGPVRLLGACAVGAQGHLGPGGSNGFGRDRRRRALVV